MGYYKVLDSLFAEIAESGWLSNNCFQLDDGSWRANLRRPDGKGDWFTDWAEGPTLADALAICMDKMATAEWTEERPITSGKAKPEFDKSEPLEVDLATALGIRKPKLIITRRL